jgi:hypothetical protein
LGEFHASIRAWFRSTIVTVMCGHLSAMTAQVGPPIHTTRQRCATYCATSPRGCSPTYPAPTAEVVSRAHLLKTPETHTAANLLHGNGGHGGVEEEELRDSGGGGGRSRKDSRRQRVAASWRTAGPFNVGSMRFVSMPFQPHPYAPRSKMCRSYSLQQHLQFTARTYRI